MFAVFSMAVFFNSMVAGFRVSLLRCFFNYFEMVLVALIIISITLFSYSTSTNFGMFS